MTSDTSGNLFSEISEELGRPVYNVTTPMNNRQPEPISFLLSPGPADFTFDTAISDLRYLAKAAGKASDIIQRVQIVPKHLLHLLDTVTTLDTTANVKGQAIVGGQTTQIFAYDLTEVDYLKAYYSGANLIIRSWGSEIAQVPLTPAGVRVGFGYSLSNGLNTFLVVWRSIPAMKE